MFSDLELILTIPPEGAKPALTGGLTPAHMAYRVGDGPHLFRAALPTASRGGYMVIDDVGFNGLGDPTPLCHEILRECAARGFTGVICDFEAKPFQVLARAAAQLGELLEKRGWPLLVPEAYAHAAGQARVLVSSALSGGSLKQKLADAVERYGKSRVVLAVERTALDFYLPSPTGQGSPLTREELKERMEALAPSVFFSDELCAHYFTYMSKQNGAHFVLFDDAGSIRKKLYIARSLGITAAVLAWPQVDDFLDGILA